MEGRMRPLRIALIGGGIGGVAAALALSRRGFAPRIYEQARDLKEIGAGIQVTPNSAKVLRALGVGDELAANGFEPECMATRDSVSGRLISRVPTRSTAKETFGAPWYQLHRADLLDMLVRALPPDIVRTGVRVTGVTPSANGAALTFADERTEEVDVVVGCDGIHSVVRETLLGKQPARFTGHMCWRALVPSDALPPGHVAPDLTAWMEPRAHVVTYYVRRGELVNIVAFRESKEWVEESWSSESDPREMLEAYAGVHPDLRLTLERVTRCFKWGVFDRDPLPLWTKGCVTLLGDAAHPMLPFLAQGAAMAIEDGYVLARELARGDDVPTALARYEEERRPRTSRVQLAARAQGEAIHFHSRLEWIKRRLGLYRRGERNAEQLKRDWIFGYDPVAESDTAARAPTAA
jgi:salicylate hydroxylase